MIIQIVIDIRYFIIIMLLFILSATNAFFVMRATLCRESTDEDCINDFSTPSKAFFAVFQLLLFTVYDDEKAILFDSQYRLPVQIMFVLSAILVPIILLALLVGKWKIFCVLYIYIFSFFFFYFCAFCNFEIENQTSSLNNPLFSSQIKAMMTDSFERIKARAGRELQLMRTSIIHEHQASGNFASDGSKLEQYFPVFLHILLPEGSF